MEGAHRAKSQKTVLRLNKPWRVMIALNYVEAAILWCRSGISSVTKKVYPRFMMSKQVPLKLPRLKSSGLGDSAETGTKSYDTS